KQGSVVVVPGQQVQRGALLGYCGNSGRSPVPHIHLQLQSNPALGAPTLPVVFAEGARNGTVCTYFSPGKDDRVAPLEIEAEVEWSLLGRESEQWVFEVQKKRFRTEETLTFTTDEFGYPALASKNNSLWHLIDLPTFIEIKPDFKTYATWLSDSAWLNIIGEGLVLPKKLSPGFRWNGGFVDKENSRWRVHANDFIFYIDPETGITEIRAKNDPKFRLKRVERKTRV
ncbi:MAG: hypothetical protein GXO92_08965, partial [FCB group bacterium]|nr:hypothetical protein [FCB group bacterium]